MAMVDEDAQLLAAYARNRDAAAFERLVERHIHFVYAAALRQIRDRQLAEDILQAVFLLLSQKAAELKPGTLIKGWLFHTTRYAANNVRRTESRRLRREREAAAMRLQNTPERELEDIAPHLDDALAGLSTKDRSVLLMRYFQEMPLAVVGQAMGISEDAAKKRVMRALERLRQILMSRGVEVSGGGLAGAMSLSAVQSAQTPAVSAIVNFVFHGASAHAGAAIPLAKGVSKTMTQGKLKLVTMKLILAAACVGAGAAVVVQEKHSETPAKTSPIILADSLPADADVAAKYQACRDVFQTLIDSYDKGDAAAAKSRVYFGPDANPVLAKIVPTLIDVDFAVYRLQKDAVARFGPHAMGLSTNWGPSVFMLLNVMPRLDASGCRVVGDDVSLMPTASVNDWPRAPLYFHNVDGVWKLDYGRTVKIDFHARRRHSVPGETRDQALCAGEKIFIDGYNAVSDDLESGKITDVGTLQGRLDGVLSDLIKAFPEINVNSGPK
ncbi:MAG TPA: sigma-70 family RNA polymerase sigma factor [Tepidisphaeraceae bacterium]|jgi:RNA polymerase sigma factor (sigma-70 family)